MRLRTSGLVDVLTTLLLVYPIGLMHKPVPPPPVVQVVKSPPVDRTLEAVHSYVTPRLRGIGGRALPPALARAVSEALVHASRAAGFDPFFIVAVVEIESRWNVEAVSPTGSRGLMQLQLATFLSVSNNYSVMDPVENVRAGVAYLAALYGGGRGFVHADSLLRAYSDGPGTAMQYNEAVRANEDLSAFSPQARYYPGKVMARYHAIVKKHRVRNQGWRLR